MQRLQNKIALITGAAKGIGQAIAELFVAEGATVIITDIDDETGLHLAEKLGNKAEYLHLDVQDESKWQKATDYITKKYKKLDILVNNAGIIGFADEHTKQDPENIELSVWNEVHQINLTGVMLGCKYAIKLMKKEGGSITNMSSRSGIVGVPRAVAYASSKAAIRNHTKSVALYCAEEKYNIRCNSIHPAAILTPMWDHMLGPEENTDREKNVSEIEAGIPLGKFGQPIDVAYGALYLASDESKYVTGIELTIDGGILAGSSAQPK